MAGERIYPDETPTVQIGCTDNHAFSERELDILRELISGDSNAEIGARLGIAASTVKYHVQNMLDKTGCIPGRSWPPWRAASHRHQIAPRDPDRL